MTIFYEVQELTTSGWQNTWNSPDNWAFYTTREEAQSDLDYHITSCEDAFKRGFMVDVPSRKSYRIVEVADTIALRGLK